MSQSGSGIEIGEVDDAYYNPFQQGDSDGNSSGTKLVECLPENYGSVLDGVPNAGQEFKINIPEGIYDTGSSFITVDATIQYKVGANAWTNVAPYVSATATSHTTIQNGAWSFFREIAVSHDSQPMETTIDLPLSEMVDSLLSSRAIAKANEKNNFCFLNRCLVHDEACGPEITGTTTAVTAGEVTTYTTTGIRNTTTYDESFERRCRLTGQGRFSVSGKLPLTLFKNRNHCVTKLHRTSITFKRAADEEMLENRNETDATLFRVLIHKIALWMKIVIPSSKMYGLIQEGISKGELQPIGGRNIQHTKFAVNANQIAPSAQMTLNTRPAKIFIGFRTDDQVSQRTWAPHNVKNVAVLLDGQEVNAGVLNIADWAGTKDNIYALYEHFLDAANQGGGLGEPAISFEQFKTNYALWAFNTTKSALDATVFAKGQCSMTINARFNTAPAAPVNMDVFVYYDSLYHIKGPSDTPTKSYGL